MRLDRRNFFRVLGATGASVALGEQLNAAPDKDNGDVVEFRGILFDATLCAGCQSCEFACAEDHGLPEPEDYPEAGVIRKTNETRRTVVNALETPNGEVNVKTQCLHCNEPACVSACLTQAMYKTREGPVIWHEGKCMGCRYCMISCPFDVPKFEYHSANPKITKCDMCYDRIIEGKLPACVKNCPAEAMIFGKRSELINEARKRIIENPDQYENHIFGESEAGGTGFMYVAPVSFDKLNFNTRVQKKSYPELTKGFLYSVPSVFVLWPAVLLGIHEATKENKSDVEDE